MNRMLAGGMLAVLALVLVGCPAKGPVPNPPASNSTTTEGGTAPREIETHPGDSSAPGSDNKPFKLGDLIEPFTPPTLEELNKSAEWVDKPVVDSLKLLRDRLAKEPPTATAAEALKLKNDSDKSNDQILSALGRLPDDDKLVDWDTVINRHSYGDVNSTNPILTSSVVESDVNGLIGFGLFSFDWNMDPFAASDSVVSWQASKDGLYDKVVMRNDLTWSDGQPITAHDVAFSFQAIMTSAVPVPAVRSGTDKLKWVAAYDDQTIVFFHKASLVTNVWNINFPVIPKHIYENTIALDPKLVNIPEHVELENNPVSGGAYVFKSRTRGQEIILERRESYYMHAGKQVRDKPYFKTIRFRIRPEPAVALLSLKAGDIDEMILNPEQWRTQTSDDDFQRTATKVRAVEWTSFHFLWNCKLPLFSDKRVRQAMAYSFDHKELLEKLRYGLDEPANGPYHPTSKWAPKPALPFFQQDLDKAEKLLDEAGWTDSDGDGIRDKMIDGRLVPFEFTVLVRNSQDRIEICSLLKEGLDQIGVRCNIKTLEFAALIDKMQKHDFQAAFGGWGTGTDPDTSENIFATGQERNYGEYSSKEIDKLFEDGRHEFDPVKRAAIYQKIHTILYEDQPYTWLYYQNAFYAFNKSLRGYVFSPRGPYHYGPGFSSIWKPLDK